MSIKKLIPGKRKLGALARNAPLAVLVTASIVCVEAISAGGIFLTNHAAFPTPWGAWPLAPITASMSLLFALLGAWGSMAAAALRSDPRALHRKRAGAAQLLALAMMAAPVHFLGESLAIQRQTTIAAELRASPAYGEYLRISRDTSGSYDRDAQMEATAALALAAPPQSARFDGVLLLSYLGAMFLHGAIMLAAGTFWRPANETPAETRDRLAAQRAARAAKTRAENKRLKAKAESPVPNVVKLLKTGLAR